LLQLNENLEKEAVERTQMTESRARQLQNLAVELIEAEENEWQLFARQGCPNTQCKEVNRPGFDGDSIV
jgi:hypothetical protein